MTDSPQKGRILDLFSPTRKIDRPIEKVIDYNATDEARIEREIEEYEVTPSVERGFRRFLEAFDQGVRVGDVTDIGVWVSGFYGSGKSSFTKYLGFALDPSRKIKGRPFVEFLAERMAGSDVRALLVKLAKRDPTAVFMLDLGTDQLAEAAHVSVTNILYWSVLRKLGFSREKKVADLELRLDGEGRLAEFEAEYRRRFPGQEEWSKIHNDPAFAVVCASQIVPKFYPEIYRDERAFYDARYDAIDDIKEVAGRIVTLIRRRTKQKNILFLVDEVGQYVAPRKDLILNLDGLVRALKEVGGGHVWFVATAQQTLTEISEKAAINSTDLYKLKDRFPLSIELEATDIREITARRLLTKNPEGEASLKALYSRQRELLDLHSHLDAWPGAQEPLDPTTFARLYPLLPTRFDLVLDLIRALARRTGGAGLRSAIRLVQDLLVDASKGLPRDVKPLAQRQIGTLVAVDDLYDTLRVDLAKEHPQAIAGVERVSKHAGFKDDALAIRVAKAVAALQPLESRSRTAENIAALLYRSVGDTGNTEAVREKLHQLVDAREFGLVELRADADSLAGAGFLYLSDEVQPIQKKRDGYIPTPAEVNSVRTEVLGRLFDPVPECRLEGTRPVQAAVRLGRGIVAGEHGEVVFRLEEQEPGSLEARLDALVAETQSKKEHENTVFWVYARPTEAEERLVDVCRSTWIQGEAQRQREKEIKADVMRYLRAEERRAERARDVARAGLGQALVKGWFVFKGQKRAVEEKGASVLPASNAMLADAAVRVFERFALIKRNVPADAAAKFLDAPRLDRMTKELDPAGFVQTKSGRAAVNMQHPALEEALRAFAAEVAKVGSGRVQGSAVLDLFHAPPYGWSKDTTRYVFAALLFASEIELHTGDSVLKTPGQKAGEVFRNTQSFNRAGLAPRGQKVPIEALDRASQRLEKMFDAEVLPLEDQISRTVRAHFPNVMERVGALPARLRLLSLPGEERARVFLGACADLLKEDAGGAASLLGGVVSTIPEDETWSRGVVAALDGGGEAEVQAARGVGIELDALAGDFEEAIGLRDHPSRSTIQDVLGSEDFYRRMADLRAAHRALQDAVRAAYSDARTRLIDATEAVRQRLQARPAWTRIGPDEQSMLDGRLSTAETIDEPAELVARLRRVLTRLLGLPALEEQLARQTQALGPERTDGDGDVGTSDGGDDDGGYGGEGDGGVGEYPPEDDVDADKEKEIELRTAADVDRYIELIRQNLLLRLRLGPIRLGRKR
jgi:hypothetical protein